MFFRIQCSAILEFLARTTRAWVPRSIFVYRNDLRRLETVKERRGSGGVSPHVFRIEHIADFQVLRKFVCQGNSVKSITSGAESSTDLIFPVLKRMQRIILMIINLSGESIIHPVV